ncbi:alpha/beta hydrolase [Lachnospiraceae bacterium 42-17]
MTYEEIPLKVQGSSEYARLQAYIQDTPHDGSLKVKRRPFVLICPGGGYERTSYREGEPTAFHFLNRGYHAGVLRYSTAPYHFPVQVLELGQAVLKLREKAEEWNIDMERLVVQGASAGGHLAASYGVFWNHKLVTEALGVDAEDLRPRGVMLSYPVITTDAVYAHKGSFENLLGKKVSRDADKVSVEKLVTKAMPPCFLWHTVEDATVPVENSILMAMALRKEGIPFELHIFPEGEHGLSLASPVVERENGRGVQKECAQWITLADAWLERLFNSRT